MSAPLAVTAAEGTCASGAAAIKMPAGGPARRRRGRSAPKVPFARSAVGAVVAGKHGRAHVNLIKASRLAAKFQEEDEQHPLERVREELRLRGSPAAVHARPEVYRPSIECPYEFADDLRKWPAPEDSQRHRQNEAHKMRHQSAFFGGAPTRQRPASAPATRAPVTATELLKAQMKRDQVVPEPKVEVAQQVSARTKTVSEADVVPPAPQPQPASARKTWQRPPVAGKASHQLAIDTFSGGKIFNVPIVPVSLSGTGCLQNLAEAAQPPKEAPQTMPWSPPAPPQKKPVETTPAVAAPAAPEPPQEAPAAPAAPAEAATAAAPADAGLAEASGSTTETKQGGEHRGVSIARSAHADRLLQKEAVTINTAQRPRPKSAIVRPQHAAGQTSRSAQSTGKPRPQSAQKPSAVFPGRSVAVQLPPKAPPNAGAATADASVLKAALASQDLNQQAMAGLQAVSKPRPASAGPGVVRRRSKEQKAEPKEWTLRDQIERGQSRLIPGFAPPPMREYEEDFPDNYKMSVTTYKEAYPKYDRDWVDKFRSKAGANLMTLPTSPC